MKIASVDEADEPIVATTEIFAAACIAAAMTNPEWAAAIAWRADGRVKHLANAIVRCSPVAAFSPTP
jgi:hypothetical protein